MTESQAHGMLLQPMPTARRAKGKKAAATQRHLSPARFVEPGDEIYVLEKDLHPQYKPLLALRGKPFISGIVCAIRNVRTGKPTAKATGKMSDYVFEVLDFQPPTPALAGPRAPVQPEVKRAVAQALKRASQSGKFAGEALASLRAGPLAGLEGWRTVRLMADQVYTDPSVASAYPPGLRQPPGGASSRDGACRDGAPTTRQPSR